MHHLSFFRSATRRTPLALLTALIAGALLGAPGVAHAATADEPEVRWSVTPADETGPDDRRAILHEIDPGESIDDHIAVRNVSDDEVTFRLTAADGFFTRNGRFDILPADQPSVASGTWIDIADEVTVGGGETVVVPFVLAVPDTAEPGDHAAGITASVLSVQSADGGASVGVDTRVGVRVITRVTGEITPAASLEAVAGSYATSWNPLRPGSVTVSFDVVNAGNTRLLAEGTVSAGTQSAVFPVEGESPQELLPGDTRTIVVVVNDVWPLFIAPTTVTLDPTVITVAESDETMQPVTADTVVWAVPWPQLVILLGLVLLIGAVIGGRVRSRRRLDSLLADAREEGRRQAATTVSEP